MNMAFFDDLSKKLTQTSQTVAKKAKDVAEVSNLKLQIREEERILKSEYAELGEKYFVLYGEEAAGELLENIAKIKESIQKRDVLKERVAKIENEHVCSSCGAKLPERGCFCTACGAKIEVPEEEEKAAEVDYHTCSGCGAQVMEGESFCSKCGKKQDGEVTMPKEEDIAEVVEEPEVVSEEEPEPEEPTEEEV